MSNGRFPQFVMYHLPGTVERIGTERKPDNTFVMQHITVQYGDVPFADSTVFELGLQMPVYLFGTD